MSDGWTDGWTDGFARMRTALNHGFSSSRILCHHNERFSNARNDDWVVKVSNIPPQMFDTSSAVFGKLHKSTVSHQKHCEQHEQATESQSAAMNCRYPGYEFRRDSMRLQIGSSEPDSKSLSCKYKTTARRRGIIVRNEFVPAASNQLTKIFQHGKTEPRKQPDELIAF
jgi:hypothetical protein